MLTKDLVILPGFGAGQNEYLISIAIGTSKRHLAMFDGDVAGEQAIQKYTRFFGVEEGKNWKKYLNSSGVEIQLEQIFSTADLQRLLSLTKMKDPKKALTALFFSSNKDSYWSGIDTETKDNIRENFKTMKDGLDLNSANFHTFK